MGQWGAYGYAVDLGANYRDILDHFYGGTSLAGDVGNPAVSVELLSLRSRETVLTGPGLAINGVALGANAVRIRGVASNTFQVLVGDGCGGPWSVWSGAANGQLASGLTVTGELRMCEPGQVRAYRGNIAVLDGGGFQTTVNTVLLDDYLRGVLPREMPASWGSAGGGRGMEALKAQAVAARSYALASQWRAYAKTCDTTSCQVYRGAYVQPSGGAVSWLEDGRTDGAVAATSGQVRRWPNGGVVRTEFSASTGGHTAGGSFPAVADRGDATAANPNRSWTVAFSRADAAARLGLASITGVRVTERNGLGADGGRAVTVVFDTSSGSRSFTGAQVRSALGLKSDWFSVAFAHSTSGRAFAQALYSDVLGRPGDPGGIDNWARAVDAGAERYGVAHGFASSSERYAQWVNTTYVLALRRAPDGGGAEAWLNYLRAGATLNDLNAAVYGSQEALNTLGGGEVQGWVDAVYRLLLGRGAAPEEQTSWARVAAQAGRNPVVMAISQSPEARNRRLEEYYQVLLGRALDDGGRSSFSGLLAGRGDVDVVALLAASPEYRQRAEARFP
ncbi:MULTISPECIES: SpoIID/LytB domain-containing protein [unclassified Modestobacter]|uniref:SpoIID/LytB domain-containing protein n=1 Tax=unclassified Modestobacter TaxID=2643866 RepID=UPI0022AAF85A|nr:MULTISPECIES: SpoIID/LytB domain-containing protein [unclassified Modestobacter]MCZ2823776.1 SpoIID/LytB domain-containing protein [Modestobacter sp. VKM Ac-2981]MCZ2852021.1 SpoIID/LytB domain-containing protein [Modestobacter sp. VKM Ac-2982]